MLEQIRQWIKPPIFPDDEDKTRDAQILYALLANMLLFLVLGTFAGICHVWNDFYLCSKNWGEHLHPWLVYLGADNRLASTTWPCAGCQQVVYSRIVDWFRSFDSSHWKNKHHLCILTRSAHCHCRHPIGETLCYHLDSVKYYLWAGIYYS